MALKNCATYLLPAIASGKPYRIARAVRAVAHTPSSADVADVIEAACDSLLAGAYATHDSRTIAGVAGARPVIRTVLEQLAAETERERAHPAAQREAVEGYLRLIELVDKSLAQRLDTVGALAARIAATMHAPAGVARDADHGGRLHDVGTISTARERGQKTHPATGEAFLRTIPSLAHLAPIVRSHHECFDGSGFPDGLRGDEIPLAARIVHVAAVFVEAIAETGRHKPMSPARSVRAHRARPRIEIRSGGGRCTLRALALPRASESDGVAILSLAQLRAVREAGLQTGTAVIHQTPQILDDVQATLPGDDLEQVDVLIRVMAAFDRDTAEHLEAVGTMSMLLAHRAGLPAETRSARVCSPAASTISASLRSRARSC